MTPGRDPRHALHLTVFVYGAKYVALFADIVLPNLAGLIDELPSEWRARTRLRILTDGEGRHALERAPALGRISEIAGIDIAGDMEFGGYDQAGGYGPMILGQSRLVREASRERAGIVFCPPDLVWSRGSFATIVALAERGYRAVIGPSARGIEEDMVPALRRRIDADPGGKLLIPAGELTGLLLDNWNQMNDGFFWNDARSNIWKSYSYYRVDPRAYLMRFHQGPMMYARPYREVVDYDGWIDHRLIKQCVRSMREVYVIEDAARLQTVDLAPRARSEGLDQTSAKRWALWRQLMNRKRHCRYNLLYGLQTCRVTDHVVPDATWRRAERQFDREVAPSIYAAVLARPFAAAITGLRRRAKIGRRAMALGRWIGALWGRSEKDAR